MGRYETRRKIIALTESELRKVYAQVERAIWPHQKWPYSDEPGCVETSLDGMIYSLFGIVDEFPDDNEILGIIERKGN